MDEAHIRTLWGPTIGNEAAWVEADPGTTLRPPGTLAGRTVGSDATPTTVTTVTSLATPAPVGRFEFLSEVGRGGMGVVWRAHQGSLGREVAIKRLPGGDDPEARRRFVAEALVTGYLDHPNIVPVHDLCEDQNGEVLLAMKLVGGRPWNRLLHPHSADDRTAAAEFDLDRHLDVLAAVCNAVAFAHARGIVHRDLKPENVMVGAFGEVLVMDWGIALDVSDDPSHATRAPHRSTVRSPSGSPSYLSPEQATGSGNAIGPRTDVFLLGAILFEIVTGRPPHTGGSLIEVLMAAADPKPLTFPADTPAALRLLCATAMAKSPAERFTSVADFQQALGAFRRTQQSERAADAAHEVLARSTADDGRADDELARNRRYAGFADAVAGFGQALVLWDGNQRARDGRRAARLAWATAALANQDLGLAATQAGELGDDVEGRQLAERIHAARNARERAARQTRLLARGLVAAGLAVVVALATGYTLVSREQARTVVERDGKEAARIEAEHQRGRAEDNAKAAASNAERATSEAEKARTEAERAKTEEAKAVAAAQVAVHEAWRARVELAKVMFERGMRYADQQSNPQAAACFLRAVELAPQNLIPAGFQAAAGQPQWADFAWRAFTLLPVGEQTGSAVSLDHFVADAAFIDSQRIMVATGLKGYIMSAPDLEQQIGYTGQATAVACSADGLDLAIAPLGRPISLCDGGGHPIHLIGKAEQRIAGMALSADGSHLAAVAWAEPNDGTPSKAITMAEAGPQRLLLFDLDHQDVPAVEASVPGGRISEMAWSANELLALAPGRLLHFNSSGKLLLDRPIEGSVTALAPDGSALLRCVGGAGGTLAILEQPLTGTAAGQILLRGIPVPTTIALGLRKRAAIIGNGQVHTLDFNSGGITNSMVMPLADLTRRARISPDDQHVLMICWSRGDAATLRCMRLDQSAARQPRAVIAMRRNPLALVWGTPFAPAPLGSEQPLAVVPAVSGKGLLVHTRNSEGIWQICHFDSSYRPQGKPLVLPPAYRPLPWWDLGSKGRLWLELSGDDSDQPLNDEVFRDDHVQTIRSDEAIPGVIKAGAVMNRRPSFRPFPVCRRIMIADDQVLTIKELPYERGEGAPTSDEVCNSCSLIDDGYTAMLQVGHNIITIAPKLAKVVRDITFYSQERLLISADGTKAVTLNPPITMTLYDIRALNIEVFGAIQMPILERVIDHPWKAFALPSDQPNRYNTVQSLVLIGDGTRMLVAYRNGDLQCWDLKGGTVLWQTINTRCTGLVADAAGQLAAGWDETLPGTILIDTGTGRRLSTIRWPGSVSPGSQVALAFNTDGQHLLVARERTCLEWTIRNSHAGDAAPTIAADGTLSPAFEQLYREVQNRVMTTGPEAGEPMPYTDHTRGYWK